MYEVQIHTQLLELQGSEHCGLLLLVRGSSGHDCCPAGWRQHRLVRRWRCHRRHVSRHHRLCYINKLADRWRPHALPIQTAHPHMVRACEQRVSGTICTHYSSLLL